MKGWKEEARRLYFMGHKGISQVAEAVGVSRQSVSSFLSKEPGFQEEKERRKVDGQIRRKSYKREKNREYREAYRLRITPDTIKREHEIAVMLLSHER